jgi:hypothetical protein
MPDEVGNTRFRYVAAEDLRNADVDFDGLDVRSPEGERLGEVDGFIVDPVSGHACYVVVESGGWFKGGQYLVAIDHAHLSRNPDDPETNILKLNLDKKTLGTFPKFDRYEFGRLSAKQLSEFESKIGWLRSRWT